MASLDSASGHELSSITPDHITTLVCSIMPRIHFILHGVQISCCFSIPICPYMYVCMHVYLYACVL